jgi:NTE family protein
MSKVGIVLGGGGITGASYQMAALMALNLATGWEPNSAEVIIGTSGGATVAAITRADRLDLSSVVLEREDPNDVAARISSHLYKKGSLKGLGRWIRKGLLPGLRRPGLNLALGAPSRHDPAGVGDWMDHLLGPAVEGWPSEATVVVAYDIDDHRRVPFGTLAAPEVSLREAISASAAVPIMFHPHKIDGHSYVDGGVSSGTNADLILGNDEPLDLIIIIAPMAADDEARFHGFRPDALLDRAGRTALDDEVAQIQEEWPEADVVILKPRKSVLKAMRPNPMDPGAAVPTFIATMHSMSTRLASAQTWKVLEKHLVVDEQSQPAS